MSRTLEDLIEEDKRLAGVESERDDLCATVARLRAGNDTLAREAAPKGEKG